MAMRQIGCTKTQPKLSRMHIYPTALEKSVFLARKPTSYIGRGMILPKKGLCLSNVMTMTRRISKELKRGNLCFVHERIHELRQDYLMLYQKYPKAPELISAFSLLTNTVAMHAWNKESASAIIQLLKDLDHTKGLMHIKDKSDAESSIRDLASLTLEELKDTK